MKSTLYKIAAIYRAQLEQLAELDLDPTTVSETLESIQGDMQDKLRAVIAYSLELDILAAGAADAAKRMAARAKTLDSRVEAMRAYALTHMQGTGIGEISTDEWAAKVAKKPPSVNVLDAALIPAAYLRTPEPPPPAPDRAAIGAALKSGASVPGCELVQGFRLALK
jgi:hypothetical protein